MITYPYLPDGRVIEYVSADNSYILLAKKICEEKSTDKNHPTGSVVVKDGNVIGMGANQAALRNPLFVGLHKGLCIRRLLKVKTGQRYWLCPGCASPESHSEQQAIRNAKINGNDTTGADLYLWGHWWCCKSCWDAIIAAKIAHVYLMTGSETMF